MMASHQDCLQGPNKINENTLGFIFKTIHLRPAEESFGLTFKRLKIQDYKQLKLIWALKC